MFNRRIALSNALTSSLAFLALLFSSAGAARAVTNTPVPPVLVPYTVTVVAGNAQNSGSGYGGEGGIGTSATLNGPNALAVDSVGNLYIVDQGSSIIREVNAQTGLIETIAGVLPTKCTGVTCTASPGCADGVPALGNPVGSKVLGLVVDSFGNVYFSDYNYQGVWVVYRGGAQPANFITLVDPSGVNTAGGVKPGYMYHIAGLAVPKAGGCTGTSGLVDKVLATQASFHDPLQMGIDAAGNLYVQDYANNVVRVINTQATAQTFFGVTVQPGFIASVVGCNSKLTVACPTSTPPFGGPASGALYSTVLSAMTTDGYGNVYELDGKGATGGIYAGVAYAGGSALANLINLESSLTATAGDWYEVINSLTSLNAPADAVQAVPANGSNDIVLRPVSIAVDPYGNLYMMDYHWQSIYRVDVNSGMATRMNATATGGLAPSGTPAAVTGTPAAPTYCNGTSGPQTTDPYGDGCGLMNNKVSTSGTGYVTFDGAGNLYFSDTGDNIVRKASVDTVFPQTAVGASVSQIIQLHFDQSNLPVTTGSAPNYGTSSFKIVAGSGATTPSTEFTVSNATCSSYTIGTTVTTVGTTTTYASSGVPLDGSLECYVTVTFNPLAPGVRGAQLQATTTNGSVYPFALSGYATGSQLAVDGGIPTPLKLNKLGNATSVATDYAGNTYIADPTNSQIVLLPANLGTQGTVGTGLSQPQGVATDAAGNIYISDTGNNRVVKVAAQTGTQTVLTTNVSKPQGLAVDRLGNVYVADTGNARVVEIPAFNEFAPAPLLGFASAQTLKTPVAVAVDKSGNVYVADSGNTNGLIVFAPGGGDLQPGSGANLVTPATSIFSFGTASIQAPSGVAIDGGGDLYVSDSKGNAVFEFPAATGPGSEPFALNFPGLSGPGGIALDTSGNLYVADTNNSRILEDNRSNLSLNFGNVYLKQTPGVIPLTVTNIGTVPYKPVAPFAAVSGTNASEFSEADTCAASYFPLGTLTGGLHCSLTATFTPTIIGNGTASIAVQGGAANIALSGVGFLPQAVLTLSAAAPGGLITGQTATVTLTATQPAASNTPSGGQVTFSYTVNGVLTTLTPVTLPASGVVTFNLPPLLQGRKYVINASYNGDAFDSASTATALTFFVPGQPVTVTAASTTSVFGAAVPTPACTVSGILPADQATVTYSCSTPATSASFVGTYPITVTFAGGNYQNYGFPTVYNAGTTTPAVETVTPAPLTVAVANATTFYGAKPLTYTYTATGLVNGDTPVVTFTPAQSQGLVVGTYQIVPSVTIGGGGSIGNYNLTIQKGTLVITQAAVALTLNQPAPAVLPTALSSDTITITAGPPLSTSIGIPTGTITLLDVFTPLTSTGNGPTVTEPKVVLNLVNGVASYAPVDPTLGNHVYTFSYGGDSNFLPTDTSLTPSLLTVDLPDFTITSTTDPIQVAPGITPGGVATAPGEQAATPEIANVNIAPILGSTETVTLTCAVPASYITCTLTPASVTLTGKTTLVSVVAVSTPANLPLGSSTSQLQQKPRNIAFAFVSLGLLSLLPLCTRRRRLNYTRLLVLLFAVATLINVSGCGSNTVQFNIPIPAGPTQITITGTSGSISRSFVVPINIQ